MFWGMAVFFALAKVQKVSPVFITMVLDNYERNDIWPIVMWQLDGTIVLRADMVIPKTFL